MEGVGVTVQTGSGGPDGLESPLDAIVESPLDAIVERLVAELYYAKLSKLLNHPAESSGFVGHNRLLSAGCPNLFDSVPLRY